MRGGEALQVVDVRMVMGLPAANVRVASVRVANGVCGAVWACMLVLACVGLLLCVAMSGCAASTRVDESSPRVAEVSLRSMSDMTESSQEVVIRLAFDQAISATGNIADSFELRLNDEAVDTRVIAVEVQASGEAVTFTLRPTADALGVGKGAYFALYQGAFSISSARSDGVLSSITGMSGAQAVLDEPISGTLPSGLALVVEEQIPAQSATGIPAQTTFRVTSPALVRCVTWFSPDGGSTKLLKHNHTFTDADASDAAADLARVINEASDLGLVARAQGDQVTLTATKVVEGQVISPCIVEGVGVQGGAFDPAQDKTE